MLELEMESLLQRLVPGLDKEWVGASEDEIQQIEDIADQELPTFYRWFLSKMGRNAGRLSEPLAAFSARSVIDAYGKGEIDAEPPLLFIACMDDPLMPLNLFYDLGTRIRDDALVVSGVAGDDISNDSETLREWMASTIFTKLRVNTSPQRCSGWFKDRDSRLGEKLIPVLKQLGFTAPISTGPFCLIYESPDAAISCGMDPEPDNLDISSFYLGGTDAGALRRVLGSIAVETSIEININEWNPPLER
jgi:hypothetical protein